MLTLASYIFTARSLIVLFLHINYFVYLHTHTEERKRLLKVYKGLCCIVFQFGNNKYFNFYVLGKAWIWPWDRRGLASWRRLWWRRGRRWAIMEKIVMDVTTEKKIKTIIMSYCKTTIDLYPVTFCWIIISASQAFCLIL